MSSQDTPIVTGETTIAELAELLRARRGPGRTWEIYLSATGRWEANHTNKRIKKGDTLAEALSALLAEIPKGQR